MYRINRPMLGAHPGMPPKAQGWQVIGGADVWYRIWSYIPS